MRKYFSFVPEEIKRRTRENEKKFCMGLADAFNESVCHYLGNHLMECGNDLHDAWYFQDFRNYIPQVYNDDVLTSEQLAFKRKLYK